MKITAEEMRNVVDELVTLYGRALVEIRVLQDLVIEKGWCDEEELEKRFNAAAIEEHEGRLSEATRRSVDEILRKRRLQ